MKRDLGKSSSNLEAQYQLINSIQSGQALTTNVSTDRLDALKMEYSNDISFTVFNSEIMKSSKVYMDQVMEEFIEIEFNKEDH